ncbi:MAG: TlpA family protein disulfide reductase [Bacteroidales bacterium]|nr:TlpA family protein disulfide reductase [Bacteroidales bacterium]
MRVKSLIIIVLLSAFSMTRAQMNDALLEKINFNDTTLINTEFLDSTLAEYIDSAQNQELSAEGQMYNYILAADNVLKNCTTYPMYKYVYQYLINGFSDLGANLVVDYMIRLPYLEYLGADDEQLNEIINIAESYNRVKIGCKAPDIKCVTVDDKLFNLYEVKEKFTILLFWSYSCPHCRDLIKELTEFADKNEDVTVVTVNVSGDLKKVRRLLKKTGAIKYQNIFANEGWNSKIVEDYAVDMTPSLFLLDEDKVIIAKPFDIDEIIEFFD